MDSQQGSPDWLSRCLLWDYLLERGKNANHNKKQLGTVIGTIDAIKQIENLGRLGVVGPLC
jgi:hypothetical protein